MFPLPCTVSRVRGNLVQRETLSRYHGLARSRSKQGEAAEWDLTPLLWVSYLGSISLLRASIASTIPESLSSVADNCLSGKVLSESTVLSLSLQGPSFLSYLRHHAGLVTASWHPFEAIIFCFPARHSNQLGTRNSPLPLYRLVLETLTPLSDERKCFRMINGVLVERTVKDVVPALQTNSDGLKKVLDDLLKQYKTKQDEMEKWKVRAAFELFW